MAKQKTRKMWTVCYILYRPEDIDNPDNWYTNSWFAFGCDKAEAKADFLRHYERERENFWGGDDPTIEISIANVFPGFSC